MALLEAHGLVKRYGRRTVVDGVDLHVEAGEIVGLLGPNGAGKTTTFRMISGMIAPNGGRVVFHGRDVTAMPMHQRARLGLGYLAQDTSIFRKLTVEQNLLAIVELMTTRRGRPFRSSAKQRQRRVDQLLDDFGLGKVRHNLAVNCSGGEQRRLEIARCLISEPMLILLDEPFTGIDPITVGDIQQIVRALRDDGIAILITDHQVAETLRITDRSYLVAGGKRLAHGTPLEIINNPQVRRVYLGENFMAGGLDAELTRPRGGQPPATDELARLVNDLATERAPAAVQRLRARGAHAVPALLGALNRPSPAARVHAHRLLCEIVGIEFPFDPHGAELTRTHQLACIHEYLDTRRAG